MCSGPCRTVNDVQIETVEREGRSRDLDDDDDDDEGEAEEDEEIQDGAETFSPHLKYWPFQNYEKPSKTYKRGQLVTIKYHRNNHRSGGFLRISLVKRKDMMNHRIHRRNAFHFSCWGPKIKVAKKKETIPDKFFFSLAYVILSLLKKLLT